MEGYLVILGLESNFKKGGCKITCLSCSYVLHINRSFRGLVSSLGSVLTDICLNRHAFISVS